MLMASAWADATRRLGPGALALIAVIGLPGCANWSALANYPQAPSFCPPDSTMPACKDLNFVAEQVQLAGAEAHSVTRAMQFNLVASTTEASNAHRDWTTIGALHNAQSDCGICRIVRYVAKSYM
ncbi:hypothetical protein GO286_04225 [Ralstonia solanacearum]|nr:hypothetical protein [Ralstonia solanacearum]